MRDLNLSIVICTYNRAEQLRKTLASLSSVVTELSSGDEVIVIDNNGRDHTHQVIESFTRAIPVRCITENKQGLANARNCGIANAKNEVVIFFDDDITVLPNCIAEYRAAAIKHRDIKFFGGKIAVDWQGTQPNWYSGERLPMLDGLIGRYDPNGDSVTYPPETHLPFGANFALRRVTIEQVGSFNPDLGVKGSNIARGEESDYFERALDLGCIGIYLPGALVGHRFQVERISIAYLFRYGIQKGLLVESNMTRSWLMAASGQFIRGLVQLVRGRKDRFYQCVINAGVYRGLNKR